MFHVSPAEYTARRRSHSVHIDPARKRDDVFIDIERSCVALTDFGECDDDWKASALHELARREIPLYPRQATRTLVTDAVTNAALLTASFDTGSVLREAWSGACAFVVHRMILL